MTPSPRELSLRHQLPCRTPPGCPLSFLPDQFPDLVAALSDPAFNGTVFAPTNEASGRNRLQLACGRPPAGLPVPSCMHTG